MNSIEKHLALIMEWVDKGFDKGAKKAKFDLDDLKKKARELGRDLALLAGSFVAFTFGLLKAVEAGAKMKDIANNFETIRIKAGLLPGVMNDIREATRGTVTDMKLMAASNRALTDGLDPTRLSELWAKAKQISEVTGTDITNTFEMLYMAIAKGQTRMLSQIGITLDAEEASKNYAASIGKEVSQLDFKDRQIAISMALEEKYIKQFKGLGQLSDKGEAYDKLATGVVNLKDKFLMMLASSPAIDKFMQKLIDKIGDLSTSMDTWEPKIRAVVDGLTKFYDGLVNFASDKAGPALKNIWEYRDAIAAIAVTLGTGLVASKIMGITVALGLVTGGTAAGITLLAAGIAGIAVQVDNASKGTRDMDRAFQGFRPGMDFIPARRIEEQATKANLALDELLAKAAAPGLVGLKVPAGGGVSDKWGGAPLAMPPPETELKLLGDVTNAKLEMMRGYFDTIKNMEQEKFAFGIGIADMEIEQAQRAMQTRRQVYQQGFAAMGTYTQKFYSHNANMGRVFNAMAIRGFGEISAAFIESKTEEWKFLAMEYTIKAIVAAAEQKWTYAAAYGLAAAKYGAGAGIAALAAGAIRSYTQQKADALVGEQEQQWNAAEASEGSATGRKQATGIVNTRPISIVVNSTSYFQAGTMVFGDSEGALQDLYNEQIRPKIEGDIASGMIQVA
jgi:hypothetical protein